MESNYSSEKNSQPILSTAISIANTVSWYAFLLLVVLVLFSSLNDPGRAGTSSHRLSSPPCEEIYVVGEGETLHTISDKCNDPFIVERNPHIHDPDDVFPGLVIKIVPSE